MLEHKLGNRPVLNYTSLFCMHSILCIYLYIPYNFQTIVVTKQPPNGKIVTTAGPPLTVIGSKRPLPQTSTTIPSVVPVITATAISSFQHVPQEQHQMQLQVTQK